jgi:exocyst complex component 2
VNNSNIPELPKDVKSAIFTRHKGFDPKVFLTSVHPAAGPDDLAYGREKLKGESRHSISAAGLRTRRTEQCGNLESMASRTGAIQRLVEENFDRFIAIKAATFNVYDEMKLGPLASEGDYGVADLKESLKRKWSRALHLG